MEERIRTGPFKQSLFYFFSHGLAKAQEKYWSFLILQLFESVHILIIPFMLLLTHTISNSFLLELLKWLMKFILITPSSYMHLIYGLINKCYIIYIICFCGILVYYYKWFKKDHIHQLSHHSNINSAIIRIVWYIAIVTEKIITLFLCIDLQTITNRVINYDDVSDSDSLARDINIEDFAERMGEARIISICCALFTFLGNILISHLCLFFSDNLKPNNKCGLSYQNSSSHLLIFELKLILVIGWIIDPAFEYKYFQTINLSVQLILISCYLVAKISSDLFYNRKNFIRNASLFRYFIILQIYIYIIFQMLGTIKKGDCQCVIMIILMTSSFLLHFFNKYLDYVIYRNGIKFRNVKGGLYYIQKIVIGLIKINKERDQIYIETVSSLLLHSLNCKSKNCLLKQMFKAPPNFGYVGSPNNCKKSIKIENDLIAKTELIRECSSLFTLKIKSSKSQGTHIRKKSSKLLPKMPKIKISDIIFALFEELGVKYKNNIKVQLYKGYYSTYLFGKTCNALETIYFTTRQPPSIREQFIIYHLNRVIENIHTDSYDLLNEQMTDRTIENINVLQVIHEEWAMNNYYQNVQQCIIKSREYWNLFLAENLDPDQILTQGISLADSIKKTNNYAKFLLQSYSTSLSFFFHYFHFQKTIANNEMEILNAYDTMKNSINRSNISNSKQSNHFSSLIQTIHVSAQRQTLGTIQNTSSEIKKLTGYEKKNIIGLNINILIPDFIQGIHTKYIHLFLDNMEMSCNVGNDPHIHGILRRRNLEYIRTKNRTVLIPKFINQEFQFLCIIEKINELVTLPIKIASKIKRKPIIVMGQGEDMNIFGFSKSFYKQLQISKELLTTSDSFKLEEIIQPFHFTLDNIILETLIMGDEDYIFKDADLINKLTRPQGIIVQINQDFLSQFQVDEINNFQNTSSNFQSHKNSGIFSMPSINSETKLKLVIEGTQPDFLNIYWGQLTEHIYGQNDLELKYFELILLKLGKIREVKVIKKYMDSISLNKIRVKTSPSKMRSLALFRSTVTFVKTTHSHIIDEAITIGDPGEPSATSISSTQIKSQFNSERKQYFDFQQTLISKTKNSSIFNGVKLLLFLCLLGITVIIIFYYIYTLINMKTMKRNFDLLKLASHRFGTSINPGWCCVEWLNMYRLFQDKWEIEKLESYYQALYFAGVKDAWDLNRADEKLQTELSYNDKELKDIEEKILNITEIRNNGEINIYESTLSGLITLQVAKLNHVVRLINETSYSKAMDDFNTQQNNSRLFREISFVHLNGYHTIRTTLDKSLDRYIEHFNDISDAKLLDITLALGIGVLLSFMICLIPLYKAFVILRHQSKTLKAFAYIEDSIICHIIDKIDSFQKLRIQKNLYLNEDYISKFILEEICRPGQIRESVESESEEGRYKEKGEEEKREEIHEKIKNIKSNKLEEEIFENGLNQYIQGNNTNISYDSKNQTTEQLNKEKNKSKKEKSARQNYKIQELTRTSKKLVVKMICFIFSMIFTFIVLYSPPIYVVDSFFTLFKEASTSLTILGRREQYSEVISYMVETACEANSTEDIVGNEKYKYPFYHNEVMDFEEYLDDFVKTNNPRYPKFIQQIQDFKSIKYLDFLKTQTIISSVDCYEDCKREYPGVASQGIKATIHFYLNKYASMSRRFVTSRDVETLLEVATEAFEFAWYVWKCALPGMVEQLRMFIEETTDSYYYYRTFQIYCFVVTLIILLFINLAFWKVTINILISEQNKSFQILKLIPYDIIQKKRKLRNILYSQ